ncbi:MAG: hypothetical protein U1A77_16205 [Pirellulales bacterium]|jgi:hypothetical protein
MVALQRISMADLARQKRLDVSLADNDELSPDHSVGQAVDHYLDRMRIDERQLRWSAFSRGLLLDNKRRIRELDPADQDWTVMPEVSAGNGEPEPRG